MHRVISRSGIILHRRLLDTVFKAPLYILRHSDDGNIINRFNQDMMLIDMTLPLDLFNTVAEFFTAVMQIVLISVASVYMVAVIFAMFISLFLIQKFYLRTSKQLRHLEIEAKAPLHAQFISTCSGLSTIRSFGWQDKILNQFYLKLDASQGPFYLLFCCQRWLQLVLNLQTAGIVLVVVGTAVGLRAEANVAALGVAFSNISTITDTLTNFIISWTSLETSLGAVSRTLSFCKNTPKETDDNAAISEQLLSCSADGTIEFRNVWAEYNPEAPQRRHALRDVSFSLPLGRKLAVCGPSGSGKSSLLLSFLFMIDISRGTVLIDGKDISTIPRSVLRQDLVVVPQEYTIIAGTLRENLDQDGIFQDIEIEGILRQCFMWPKVEKIGGLNMNVTPETFSTGESHLLSLARAILKSRTSTSKIVLIDESLSRCVCDLTRLSESSDLLTASSQKQA